MLNEKEVNPDVILIQETWLENDDYLSNVQIEGYNCINQGYKVSRHGGLITYVKPKFTANILDICPESQIWEGLFIEIITDDGMKSKYIIGNIYKPPRDNNTVVHQCIHRLRETYRFQIRYMLNRSILRNTNNIDV